MFRMTLLVVFIDRAMFSVKTSILRSRNLEKL